MRKKLEGEGYEILNEQKKKKNLNSRSIKTENENGIKFPKIEEGLDSA